MIKDKKDFKLIEENRTKLSIIIPVYNERATIEKILGGKFQSDS